jgi:hypothetical protein
MNDLIQSVPERHIFLLWPNAMHFEEIVFSRLKATFSEVRQVHLKLSDGSLIKKITKLYDISERKAIERLSVSGSGLLTIFIVTDTDPKYDRIFRYGTGYDTANINVSICKEHLRTEIGHPHLLHSSNTIVEARRDLRILLGPYNSTGEIITDEAFTNKNEVFSYLNDTDHYLVLRDYSSGDIDILTRRTPEQIANLLDARHERMRFLKFDSHYSLTPLDVTHIHNGEICPIWCEDMLRSRVFDSESNCYRPSDENLLFSLLYRYLLNKKKFPDYAKKKIIDLACKLNYEKLSALNFDAKADVAYQVVKFLKRNHYSVPIPIDPSIAVNNEVVKYLRSELLLDRLNYEPRGIQICKSQTDNLVKRTHTELHLTAISLLKKCVKANKSIPAARKGHQLLRYGLLETLHIPFKASKVDDRKIFVLKIYCSKYSIVLERIERSLRTASLIQHQMLCSPVSVDRTTNCVLSLERFITGLTLEEYMEKNGCRGLVEQIISQTNELKKVLYQSKLRHGDIHNKNIMVNNAGELQLIDFKYSSSLDESILPSFNPMKSICYDDQISIDNLNQGILNKYQFNEQAQLYNPSIDKFIAEEFKKRFDKELRARTVKTTIGSAESIFLNRLLESKGVGVSDLTEEEAFFLNFERTHLASLETIRSKPRTFGNRPLG